MKKIEEKTPARSVPLSPNMQKRIKNLDDEYQKVTQQLQQEMNTIVSCFAEGVGLKENQYFQLSADRQTLEIYEYEPQQTTI